MKPLRTWIRIADDARAHFLENHGPDHHLIAVEGLEFSADNAATHDLVSDREGRSLSSHGPGRSAIQARSDPHRELKTQFAKHMADVLDCEVEHGRFHQLILVAAPAALGDLRAAISDKVRATVVGEVAHDLTKTPNNEIAPVRKSFGNCADICVSTRKRWRPPTASRVRCPTSPEHVHAAFAHSARPLPVPHNSKNFASSASSSDPGGCRLHGRTFGSRGTNGCLPAAWN